MSSRFGGVPASSIRSFPQVPLPAREAPSKAAQADNLDRVLSLKMDLHQKLLDTINLSVIDQMEPADFRREVGEVVGDLLSREQVPLNSQEKAQVVSDILDELLGLGPLEPLLKDPNVSDILVNTSAQIFVERGGRLQLTSFRFKDDRHLLRIINKIVSAVGRRADESQPLVDARLGDGSRVNAVIPPIAVDGPLLSIRKFSKQPIDLRRLIDYGSLSPEMAVVLEAIVKARLNIIISGGTGTGKTTLLNAMSSAIEMHERIVTIEDAAELQLQQPHVARMETRPANIEGRGEITQRDLVRNALRMRPDRIILGEVRSGEAFDMLQAMNTGHDGSMCTIHANTCRDAMARLEQMIGMAGLDMSPRSIRAQISSAVDVVLQLERMGDGRRRLTSIHEVTELVGETISMNEIFRFQRVSTDADGKVQGSYWATGVRPQFAADLAAKGIELPAELFTPHKPLN